MENWPFKTQNSSPKHKFYQVSQILSFPRHVIGFLNMIQLLKAEIQFSQDSQSPENKTDSKFSLLLICSTLYFIHFDYNIKFKNSACAMFCSRGLLKTKSQHNKTKTTTVLFVNSDSQTDNTTTNAYSINIKQ